MLVRCPAEFRTTVRHADTAPEEHCEIRCVPAGKLVAVPQRMSSSKSLRDPRAIVIRPKQHPEHPIEARRRSGARTDLRDELRSVSRSHRDLDAREVS